jgi:hypothetical protein
VLRGRVYNFADVLYIKRKQSNYSHGHANVQSLASLFVEDQPWAVGFTERGAVQGLPGQSGFSDLLDEVVCSASRSAIQSSGSVRIPVICPEWICGTKSLRSMSKSHLDRAGDEHPGGFVGDGGGGR